jgi:hypothetical protein
LKVNLPSTENVANSLFTVEVNLPSTENVISLFAVEVNLPSTGNVVISLFTVDINLPSTENNAKYLFTIEFPTMYYESSLKISRVASWRVSRSFSTANPRASLLDRHLAKFSFCFYFPHIHASDVIEV